MDDPEVDPLDLTRNFDDIERANRMFGGIAPVVREVFSRKAEWVLDVGCGSGDIARALISKARRRGRSLEIVCVDHSEAALEIARERTRGEDRIRFTGADAMVLPFPDNSFDVATCSLTLHHFNPDEAVLVLRELRRVSRLTPLVFDLRRSLGSYFAALLFVTFFAKSRLTKHDGPLSARRAYTPREALGLAEEAGWNAPRVTRLPWERMLLYDGGD
jgi:ubiquinone/menaquinone biosynthesis C-methylase UbiE